MSNVYGQFPQQFGTVYGQEQYGLPAMGQPMPITSMVQQYPQQLATMPMMQPMQPMMMMMQQQQQQAPQQTSRNVEALGNIKAGESIAGGVRNEGDLKGKVTMISGCKDEQTSADVSNTGAFGLPTNAGPGGAGGACTNALLKTVHDHGIQGLKEGRVSYGTLLVKMNQFLRRKNYDQVPQLSSGQKMSTAEPWLLRSNGSRRTKALFIGINYTGTPHVLKGCHNDAIAMKQHVTDVWGFNPNNMRMLMDDGKNTPPTRANIIAGMRWLVEGVQPGDSLFLHYSGHGSREKDLNGDEVSGYDSVMCPSDMKTAGTILDDDIFTLVAAPIPRGAELFALMDCCHSGTIMDLPYNITCDKVMEAKVAAGLAVSSTANPHYYKKGGKLLAVAAAGGAGFLVGGPLGCLAAMCCATGAVVAHDRYKK
jgi:hypothetical protein